MNFQLKRRKEELMELKDKWSQPPLRKVNETVEMAALWTSVMVGYDEYERGRLEAEIRAARIWKEHERNGSVWSSVSSEWTEPQSWKDSEEDTNQSGSADDREEGDDKLDDNARMVDESEWDDASLGLHFE
jgi:hypothetical protein